MSFLIKKNSQSFKYLSRWNINYKLFKNDDPEYNKENSYYRYVAHDFCSYYRDVLKLTVKHFFILLMIPSFLKAVLVTIPITPLIEFNITNALWLAIVIPGTTCAAALIIFSIMCIGQFLIKHLCNVCYKLFDKFGQIIPISRNEKSLFSTWLESKKNNYCPMIEYETQIKQDSL